MKRHLPCQAGVAETLMTVLLAAGLAGCADDEAPLNELSQLTAAESEAGWTFEWLGPAVHELEVYTCAEGCVTMACHEDGYPDWEGGTTARIVWDAGFAHPEKPEDYGAIVAKPPRLASGVVYGGPASGDERGIEAEPLVAGRTYAVHVTRLEPCDNGDPSCGHTRAQDCAIFRP